MWPLPDPILKQSSRNYICSRLCIVIISHIFKTAHILNSWTLRVMILSIYNHIDIDYQLQHYKCFIVSLYNIHELDVLTRCTQRYSLNHYSNIKTHDSESRGQEEAGRTRRTSVLFTGTTGVKFVNALNKPP